MELLTDNFNVTGIAIACYVAPGTGAPNHPNRPNHGLVLTLGGRTVYAFADGQCITAEENTLTYLPKGESYTVKGGNSGGCYAINFELSEPIKIRPAIFPLKHAAGFLEHFSHAERAWRTKSPGFEMLCKAEVYHVLVALRQEQAAGYVPKSALDRLRPALERIHSAYTEETISVPGLAAMCGMSETYFRRLFRKGYGVAPQTYIRELKITRAKELIDSGIYSIGEIAELSGFHDECYFSREFRKAVGVSPGKYGKRT